VLNKVKIYRISGFHSGDYEEMILFKVKILFNILSMDLRTSKEAALLFLIPM
jgi:hypothetical protein